MAEGAGQVVFLVSRPGSDGLTEDDVAWASTPEEHEQYVAFTVRAMRGLYRDNPHAAYVSVWLDTLFGQNVGNALNTAVVEMLAGNGDAESIVSTVNAAAAKE